MSTIRVTTIATQAGVEVYTAKAWVNFNGTGTVAIRASGNVSSITDNGTGDYTVNFTVAMVDINYAYACESANFTDNNGIATTTTSSCRVRCFSKAATTTLQDSEFVSAVIFR